MCGIAQSDRRWLGQITYDKNVSITLNPNVTVALGTECRYVPVQKHYGFRGFSRRPAPPQERGRGAYLALRCLTQIESSVFFLASAAQPSADVARLHGGESGNDNREPSTNVASNGRHRSGGMSDVSRNGQRRGRAGSSTRPGQSHAELLQEHGDRRAGRRLLRLLLDEVRRPVSQLRHLAQRLHAQHGGVVGGQDAGLRFAGGLQDPPELRSRGVQPDRVCRAGRSARERRGSLRQLSGRQDADRLRQVRHQRRRRGHRGEGQLELQPFAAVRPRHPVLPRRPAHDLHGQRQGHLHGRPRQRLEQRRREQLGQDVHGVGHAQAHRQVHAD